MALRVAALGVGALVMFAIVFFRLWYLEVLSGDKYRAEANNNKVRLVREQAPRGAIVDRDNRTLVENRQATVVQLRPTSLPDEERDRQSKRNFYRIIDRFGSRRDLLVGAPSTATSGRG